MVGLTHFSPCTPHTAYSRLQLLLAEGPLLGSRPPSLLLALLTPAPTSGSAVPAALACLALAGLVSPARVRVCMYACVWGVGVHLCEHMCTCVTVCVQARACACMCAGLCLAPAGLVSPEQAPQSAGGSGVLCLHMPLLAVVAAATGMAFHF